MKQRLTPWKLIPFLLVLAVLVFGCQSPPSQPAATPIRSPTPAKTASPPPAGTPTIGGTTISKQYSAPPPMSIDPNKSYAATLHTTLGDMQIELFAKEVPKTVNNFVFLARDGFYNNVKFHRIIKGFMIQTGDPTGTGAGSPGYRFDDEPVTRNYVRGTVAMANSGKNTNGSQFFIVHADAPLPKNYTIFGQVTDKAGLETLDKIAGVPVRAGPNGEMSVPTQDVRITSVDVVEK